MFGTMPNAVRPNGHKFVFDCPQRKRIDTLPPKSSNMMNSLSRYLSLKSSILNHCLSNNNRVQGSSPQKLISNYKEFQRIIKSNIFANSSNLNVILSSGCERHGVFQVFGIVDEFDSRGCFQSRACCSNIDFFFKDAYDGFGVGTWCRDTDGSATVILW